MATQIKPLAGDYDADAFDWSQRQAAALRDRRVDLLDWNNLAEEIESVGNSERSKLESAIRLVLHHMLKWDNQLYLRSRSWTVTIANGRDRARKALRQNPSLKRQVAEIIDEEYPGAKRDAAFETGLPTREFPAECPYDFDTLMTRPIAWDGEEA